MFNRRSEKFNCQELTFEVNCFQQESLSFRQIFSQLNGLFDQLHQEFVAGINDQDEIRIVFQHDQIEFPVSIPFLTKDNMSPE
jgi:hypothetical protein